MKSENRRLAIAATSGVLATIAVVGGVLSVSATNDSQATTAPTQATATVSTTLDVGDPGLSVTIAPGILDLTGTVASEADLSRIRAAAVAARSTADVTAVTAQDGPGIPTAAAIDYVERLIPQSTKRLKTASLSVSGDVVRVNGEARTLSGKRTLARSFEAATQSGLQVYRTITLSPRLRYYERAQNELQAVIGREGIHFSAKNARLTPQGRAAIDRAIIVLRRYPKLRYRVSGYTDNRGTRETNDELSHARADAVVKQLLARGITKSSIEDEGYGAVRPLGNNDSPTGYLRNSRVEIDVEG